MSSDLLGTFRRLVEEASKHLDDLVSHFICYTDTAS